MSSKSGYDRPSLNSWRGTLLIEQDHFYPNQLQQLPYGLKAFDKLLKKNQLQQ